VAAIYSADEIIELTGARMAAGITPDEAGEIASDTRSELTGSWFVALTGKNFDGHDFIGEAFSAGALGCIVADRPSYPIAATSFPLLAVDDTEEALAILARNWRRRTRKKIVLVAASSLSQVSPLAHALYEDVDCALGQTPSTVTSSSDFSAPAPEAPRRGPHLSTQFSLDPAAAFPTAGAPFFAGDDQVQSVLTNWKLNIGEILTRFLNLPDEVEYIVADFSPQPLDRAVWLIECLAPNALLLAEDSYDFDRMNKGAQDPLALKGKMIEAVVAAKGQAFTDSKILADEFKAKICLLEPTAPSGAAINYQPLLKWLGL